MIFRKNNKLFFWLVILVGLILSAGRSITPVVKPTSPTLIINEFMASNSAGLTDEDGHYSDWIEIYNPAPYPVNLSGWALTDNPNDLEKWPFPDLSLPAQTYLIVFASGKDRKVTTLHTPLHANFKLRNEGEFLALYNILDAQLQVAATESSPQFQDVAYGRYGLGSAYGYLAATPGQANDSPLLWQDVVAEVKFSPGRGFYESTVRVELATATPDATIRYTLDGSRPTETNGLIYSQPMAVAKTTFLRAAAFKPGFRSSAVATHSYIFLEDILSQPPNPPGFPETWGVYRETYKTAVEGQVVPTDYEMDPEIVNAPRYRQTLKDDLKSLPSLSIVMNGQDFDIYSRPRERGRDWERPASLEFIDPTAPERNFHIDAGLRIQGDIGREEYIPKHSFRLFFRNEYGAGRLRYPLFPNSPVEEFDTLTLRGQVQSSYISVWDPRRRDATYTQDEWLRTSQIEMSGLGSHGIFVHLYLNGLYWGLYNIVEKPDEKFGASYFKVNEEDWYAFSHDGIVNGDKTEIEKLFDNFINGDSPQARYEAIKPHLDTTAFADYLILNWYAGMSDWPENNWYAGMPRSGGKLRFFVWDGELTWRDGARLHLGKSNLPGYLWPNTVELFFNALSQTPDFRLELADRLYKHLFNDGVLTDANSQARWLRLNQLIERAMSGEIARWGDAQEEPPLDHEDWERAVTNVLRQMEGNGARLIAQAREAGFYPTIDPPIFNQHGGVVEPGFKLEITAPTLDGEAGTTAIYYTTSGADPRLPGSGAVSPEAILYTGPVVLTAAAHLKARLWVDQPATRPIWSALNEASFNLVEQDFNLRLTEVMYNPAGQADYEFIELKNTGRWAIDLSGLTFAGIDYSFPVHSARLAPGELLVLARNSEAFAKQYPTAPIFGTYDGQLSNKGETISLKDSHGRTIFSLTYDDENGWPLSPDGRGDSLVFANPSGDPNDPKNWRASSNRYGSPGVDEVISFDPWGGE
jgi:hypothetical protein